MSTQDKSKVPARTPITLPHQASHSAPTNARLSLYSTDLFQPQAFPFSSFYFLLRPVYHRICRVWGSLVRHIDSLKDCPTVCIMQNVCTWGCMHLQEKDVARGRNVDFLLYFLYPLPWVAQPAACTLTDIPCDGRMPSLFLSFYLASLIPFLIISHCCCPTSAFCFLQCNIAAYACCNTP